MEEIQLIIYFKKGHCSYKHLEKPVCITNWSLTVSFEAYLDSRYVKIFIKKKKRLQLTFNSIIHGAQKLQLVKIKMILAKIYQKRWEVGFQLKWQGLEIWFFFLLRIIYFSHRKSVKILDVHTLRLHQKVSMEFQTTWNGFSLNTYTFFYP